MGTFLKNVIALLVHDAFSKTLFSYWKFQRYASWTVFQSVIALLWRSITLLQKRYRVMGSFWERRHAFGAHNA